MLPIGTTSRDGGGIWKVVNKSFSSNTYVCATGEPSECILVDPGLDVADVDEALKKLGLKPRYVFCTHGHFDHAGGAAFFQKNYGAKVFLQAADLKTLRASNFLLMAFKMPQRIDLPELELIAEEDFSVPVGTGVVSCRLAPGHTPGSCIIRYGDAVFTGDTMLRRGVGLAELPGEDQGQLRASLLMLWNVLPLNCTIYPGHGKPASFASIRENNLALLAFLGLAQPGAV